jgi:peptidoglycan/LPS O-acetylase OafA/YrhL
LTPVLGLAGAAGLAVYALAAFKLVTVYALPINTLVAGACVLPILAAAGNSGAVAQLLSFRPLVFLGRISYSLYVWHLPVFAAFGVTTSNAGTNAARELLAVAAATLFAIASYYCVERPFLRLKDRFREPERRTDARTEGVQAAPAVAA